MKKSGEQECEKIDNIAKKQYTKKSPDGKSEKTKCDHGGMKQMANILISPSKYVQGAGEMKKLGAYTKVYGQKALILISAGGKKRVGGQVEESFREAGIQLIFDTFGGECSKTEINRLTGVVKENGCDVVIGIGGGKIFDTAKAVAYYACTPVIICPTIASTDAPCSAL